MIDTQLIIDSMPALLHGAGLSLLISFVAAIIGLTVGTILTFGETSYFRPARYAVMTYVTLLRGTPMLVQILFIFYVLPQFGLMIPPFWAATLAIGLNSGAYISQMLRSGINAVSKGQIEAASTLGLTKFMTMRYIVIPQAFRAALPSLGNELVTLVKDSSLASIIGVMELSKQASVIRSQTYDAFSILLTISLIYLALTATVSYGVKKLEGAMANNV
jgi:His/Glu/Gln/Arg/opine family amino acid ABC transporter permease subunit